MKLLLKEFKSCGRKNKCDFCKFERLFMGFYNNNTKILRDIQDVSGYIYYYHASDGYIS